MKKYLMVVTLVVALLMGLSLGAYAETRIVLLTTDGPRLEATENDVVVALDKGKIALGYMVDRSQFELLGAVFVGGKGFGVEGFIIKPFVYENLNLEARAGFTIPFESSPEVVFGLGYRF